MTQRVTSKRTSRRKNREERAPEVVQAELVEEGGEEEVRFDAGKHPAIARRYCEMNGQVSFRELGKVLGVSHYTVSNWFYRHEVFYNAVNEGCDRYFEREAEKALQSLITGETIVETTTRTRLVTRYDRQGNPHQVEEEEKTERERRRDPHHKAVVDWLRSRRPQRWPGNEERVSHEHQHTHQFDISQKLKELKPDELRSFQKQLKRLSGERSSGSD